MKVKLLYFAAVRDLVGVDEEEVELGADVRDVAALRRWLESARPALAGRLAHVRLARNEAFAADADAIGDGDVVALIPPVAGG